MANPKRRAAIQYLKISGAIEQGRLGFYGHDFHNTADFHMVRNQVKVGSSANMALTGVVMGRRVVINETDWLVYDFDLDVVGVVPDSEYQTQRAAFDTT